MKGTWKQRPSYMAVNVLMNEGRPLLEGGEGGVCSVHDICHNSKDHLHYYLLSLRTTASA